MQLAPRPDDSATARDDVSASELNAHAFCAKAWHLQYVLRVAPSRTAVERRVAGEVHHVAHGQTVATRGAQSRIQAARTVGLARIAVLLLAAALLAALTAVLLELGR